MSIPQPQIALVFHGSSASSISCVTRHEIDKESGLKLGKYVELEDCISLMQSQLSEKTKSDNGIVIQPQNILVNSREFLIWHKRSHQGEFWFRDAKRKLRFDVNYPPFLFVLDKRSSNSLSVFTLPTNSRPTLKTHLYHAPVMNVYSGGLLCLGSAVLPENQLVPTELYLNEVESALFHSYFTHVNHAATLKAKGGVNTSQQLMFWQKKSESNGKIKMSELNRYMKLGEYLKSIGCK